MSKSENRKASRIALNTPMIVESIGQQEITLHDNLAKVYTRVVPSAAAGNKFPATLRDLSTNGAFVAGEALPLLSRIAVSFSLPDFGQVEAIGWTLWRRGEDCTVPNGDSEVTLPAGFGFLFEAIPLDARLAIHRLVQRETSK